MIASLLIVHLLLNIQEAFFACNECNRNTHIVCTDSNKYRTCDPILGTPNSNETSCPTSTVCNSEEPSVCVSISTSSPECDCGFCKNGLFACTAYDKFAFCSNPSSPIPDSGIYACPSGMKCDTTSSQYCSKTGHSDCVNSGMGENKNCSQSGRFPIAGSDCRKYYLCANGTRYEYTCGGSSLFSPELSYCSSTYVCEERT